MGKRLENSKNQTMKCLICQQAHTENGFTTVTFIRAGATIITTEVPAQICPNCGEDYVDETVAAQLLESAQTIAQSGATLDVRPFQTNSNLVTA